MKKLLLALLFAIPSFASTVTCANNSGDAALIQAAVNAGGTVTIVGTCAKGSTTTTIGSNVNIQSSGSNGNTSGHGATSNTVINCSGSGFAFTSAGDNNTINGFTINGCGGAHLTKNDTAHHTGQVGWTFTNNTVENVASVTGGFIVDHILGRGSPNNHNNINNNYFFNFTSASPNASWGVFWDSGLDETTIQGNFCDTFVYGNCLKGFDDWFSGNTDPYVSHNVIMKDNDIQRMGRIGIENQGNVGGCPGGCNPSHHWSDGWIVQGNFIHNMATPINNNYAYSLFMADNAKVLNNTAINVASSPCSVRLAIGYEWAGFNGSLFQGNVLGSIATGCGGVGWIIPVTTGFASIGNPGACNFLGTAPCTVNYTNNVYRNPVIPSDNNWGGNEGGSQTYCAGGSSGHSVSCDQVTYIKTGEFQTKNLTGLGDVSKMSLAFTLPNNQSFPSGGTGTWNVSLVSNLSIRQVCFYIDIPSGTPISCQEIQDVSTTFDVDQQWLYHETFNTSTLAAGPHKIYAIATDVSATASPSTIFQSFTVAGTTAPFVTISPTSLTYNASGAQVVTISNTGTATLNLTGFTFTGTGIAAYSQTNTCPSTLAPTASCTITVTFAPTTGGTFSASLNITNNSSVNPSVIPLTGSTAVLIFSQTVVPSGGTTYAVNSTYQPGTNTINGWISLSGISGCTGEPIMSYGESTASPFENYILQLSSTCQPQFYFRSGTSGTGSGNIVTAPVALTNQGGTCTSSANCTMVTVTYNASTITVYVNATIVMTLSVGGTPIWYQSGLASGLGVGRKFDIPFTFPGTISTVSEYNGEASQQFIQNLFAQGPAPTSVTVSCIPANCVAQANGTVQLNASSAVSWSVMSGSRGTLATAGPSTFNVYTAPSTIDEAHNSYGGCMVLPNDSVFNTPVSSLPVNSNNTAWLAAIVSPNIGLTWSWDANVINSSTPPTTTAHSYYTPANDGPYQIPAFTNRLRENGAVDNYFSGQDHHMVSINGNSCNFYESYQDREIGAKSGACTPGVSVTGCDASSLYQYSSYSYAMPPLASASPAGGTTDAAGLPLWPLTLTAQDIKNALAGTPIAHALRLTMSTGSIYNGAFLWPATNQNGGSVTTAPPMGARLRMKSSFSCSSLSTASQAVCAVEKSQGMFVADISGGGNQITVAPSVLSDPATRGVFAELASIPLTAYEFVDESSLQLSSTLTVVNPANGHVTPSNSAIIGAGSTPVPIILDPVTIGTDLQRITAIAGSSWSPNFYINGTGTTTITAAINGCSAGAGNCGTWAGGVYTAPATVAPGTVLTANLVVSPTVDTAVSVTIPISIMSAGCICIDSGASSSYGPDAHGNIWSPDSLAPPLINIYAPIDTPWPSTVVDHPLFETILAPVGDIQYNFAMPVSGNYKVTLTAGVGYDGGGGPLCNVAPSSYDTVNRLGFNIYGNGVLGYSNWTPGYQMVPSLFGCFEPTSVQFPVVVTNGILNINFAAFGSDALGRAFNPYLTNFKIESDNAAQHFTIIDTNSLHPNWVSAGDPAFSYYAVSWYYVPGTLTWSLTGPGSIATNADGTATYTPPGSLATSANAVISVTDGVVSQTTNLWVQGATTQIH